MLFSKLKNTYDEAQLSANSSTMTEKRFGFAPIAQNETHKHTKLPSPICKDHPPTAKAR